MVGAASWLPERTSFGEEADEEELPVAAAVFVVVVARGMSLRSRSVRKPGRMAGHCTGVWCYRGDIKITIEPFAFVPIERGGSVVKFGT